ncbi:MAG: tripartite tricarboxylate transporter permease, partial [Alphaproteobacteria bacterium]|nr:tripartite tricarboxylate transporter permease [Alphaproteobacteria bacterium]
NLPLVGIWASLLRVRFWILAPIIALVSCIGVYSVDSSPLSVTLLAIFGPLGFLLARLGADMAPMLLGFILGPMMEEYFRRAMILSKGDLMTFVERPISASILLIAAALVAFRVIGALRERKAS